ncbi:hypothetical protein AA106556_1618 [Neokomagataea tanensis NBRC 106556]|uniref:Uncharacterized protein n=1 Tax=Neokomagataea tanensis NBRC 106556 TaxID=1223519 RepID=A0ABQ0QKC6_9PROT|nr:hypothetical protein AA106556_1618 [Neokomagataea tanensis NBRC 106556]
MVKAVEMLGRAIIGAVINNIAGRWGSIVPVMAAPDGKVVRFIINHGDDG